MVPLDRVREHERMEMEYWRDWYEAAPPEVAAHLGHAFEVVEGAYLLILSKLDVPVFNRVLGLGLEKPATEAQVDGIIARYKAAGSSRFFVSVSPGAEPASTVSWLEARGFRRFNRWAKVERGVEPVPAVTTDARIEEVGPEHARTFGDVLCRGVGLPEGMGEWRGKWAGRLLGRQGWRIYMAFDGAKAVGAAGTFVKGEWASLGFAATLPEARGRGVQSALIARRIQDARAMGCRRLSSETAEDTPDRPAPSFHNLTRLGFELAYYRENHLGTTQPSA